MKEVTIHLSLDGGMDQRTYARHVPTTSVLDAKNVRHHRGGAADKRPGTAALLSGFTDSSSLVAGKGTVLTHRDELVVTDGYTIGSYTALTGSDKLVAKGKVPEATSELARVSSVSQRAVVSMGQVCCALGTSGGRSFWVYAWSTANAFASGSIYVTVVDATTGAQILSSYLIADATAVANGYNEPKLVSCGGVVSLLYSEDNGSGVDDTVYSSTFNPSTLSWGAPVLQLTNKKRLTKYDVCATAARIYVAYQPSTFNLTVRSYNSSMILLSSIASTDSSSANTIGITATASETVWVVYRTIVTTDHLVNAVGFDDSLSTQTVVPFVINTFHTATLTVQSLSVVRTATTKAIVVVGGLDAGGIAGFFGWAHITTSGTSSYTAASHYGYWLTPASKPFVSSTSPLRVHAWAATGGARYSAPGTGEQAYQYSYHLVELHADVDASDDDTVYRQPRPTTWQASRIASPDVVRGGIGRPSAVAQDGSVWRFAAPIIGDGIAETTLAAIDADFSDAEAYQPAELGDTLHLSPGWLWDSSGIYEIGYCHWPQKPGTATFSAASGHLTAGKTYRRRVVYEWADSNGYTHRSQPSDILEFTVSATNDTATYAVPTLALTARDGVKIVVYGTVSTDVDGETYYRLLAVENAPTAMSVTVTDPGSTTLTQQPELYTIGGDLPNVQVDGCKAMVTYRNRVWMASRNVLRYSKAFVVGDGVSFADDFSIPLETTEAVKALWVMDDALYAATSSRIYVLQGDGPNDAGVQSDFGTPNRLAVTNGCVDARGVVVTPVGTFFRSDRGIELLDRSRQVSPDPIGVFVQDELETYPTVTSATVHPDVSGGWVTFTATNDSTGERLVYDYAAQKWSRDDLGGARVLSAAVCSGTMYYLTDQGAVRKETSDYLDSSVFVPKSVRTAWIKGAGLQGYQFVREVLFQGEKVTSADLTITPYFDYSDTPGTPFTFPATGGNTPLDAMPIPQVSIRPVPERCQAVSFEISEATPTGASVGTGQGILFAGLSLRLEVDDSLWKTPSTQRQ